MASRAHRPPVSPYGDGQAPAGYVPGLGRGAAGFTTRGDIGPGSEGVIRVRATTTRLDGTRFDDGRANAEATVRGRVVMRETDCGRDARVVTRRRVMDAKTTDGGRTARMTGCSDETRRRTTTTTRKRMRCGPRSNTAWTREGRRRERRRRGNRLCSFERRIQTWRRRFGS